MITLVLHIVAVAGMVFLPAVPFMAVHEPYEGRHREGKATGSSAQCGRVLL